MFSPSRERSLLFYGAFVTLPIVLLIVVLATFMLALVRFQDELRAHGEFEEQIKEFYLVSLDDAIWDFREGDIEGIANGILAIPSITGVRIIRRDAILVNLGQETDGVVTSRYPLEVGKINGQPQWILEIDAIKLSFLSVLARYLSQSLVLMAVTVASVGVVLNYMFRRYVLNPTHDLRRALADSMRDGTPRSVSLDVGTPFEIAVLRRGYNDLVHRIESDKNFQAVRDRQNQYHFDQIQAFSHLIAAQESSLEQIVQEAFCALDNEQDVSAAFYGLFSDGDRIQVLHSGQLAGIDLVKIDDPLYFREIWQKLENDFGILYSDEQRTQYYHKFQINQRRAGITIIETTSKHPAIRESSGLFLFSISSLALLTIETMLHREAEIILRRDADTVLSAIEVFAGVFLFGKDGQLIRSNDTGRRLVFETDEHICSDLEQIACQIHAILAKTNTGFKEWIRSPKRDIDFEAKTYGGVWLRFSATGISDGALLLQVRDISGEKSLRNTEERNRRMQEIGQTASGLSHDFNNHLQVISGSLELALMKIDQREVIEENLTSALKQCALAKGMTRQILNYLENSRSEFSEIDLEPALEDFLQNSLQNDSDFTYELNVDELTRIYADETSFKRTIQNLLSNAIYQGVRGRIKPHIDVRVWQEDSAKKLVKISFEDNCGGFTREALAKGADPFFTTKVQGDGTGLGLALVREFVTSCGGELLLENGKLGAKVTLQLPLSPNSGELAEPIFLKDTPMAPRQLDNKHRNLVGANVIVIEDATQIQRVIQAGIGKSCNSMTFCASVCEFKQLDFGALAAADVMISDVNLPDGYGPDEIFKIEEKYNLKIPCLFISGDETQPIAKHQADHQMFLAKPFRLEELARCITTLMALQRGLLH